MEALSSIYDMAVNYLMMIRVTDVIDMAIIAFVVYNILIRLRSTTSVRILQGVLVLLLIMWLSMQLNLRSINFLLSHAVQWGVLALVIIFQPELRRALEKIGSSTGIKQMFIREESLPVVEQAIQETVSACVDMSQSRTGALIVFEREIHLDEILRSGTKINADVSSELLKNVFFIHAPMHDGAAIVREGRLLGAGCMLPLSKNVNLSRDLGMRHRAGIGISENSDAVVVLVSEETGAISAAVDGSLRRHLSAETLEKFLRNELIPHNAAPEEKRTLRGGLSSLRDMMARNGENHEKQ